MSKLYVAYGSNLNIRQMTDRCPKSTIFSTGLLINWELLYRGTRRGSGVATIRRKKGSCVPVGLWMIDEVSEQNLDVYEGWPYLYRKQNVYVTLPDGSRRLAMVYIMNSGRLPCYPSQYYEDTIRQGYRDFGLDMDAFDRSLEYCKLELR